MNNGESKTILLVEDEVIIALSQSLNLKKYGYTVIIASSGEKAIDTIDNRPDIDLILMDIDLGTGLDGTETAAIILKKRNLPVVFLSSHTEPIIVEKTEKITSYGYVVKNSSITVLDASIKMAFKLFESNKKICEKNKELRNHSQLIENIIEQFPGFVIWKDPHSIFLGCNNNFALKCGFKNPAEIIGKSDYDLPFQADEVASFLADDRMVMQTRMPKLHFEEQEHVANGELIFLDTCKIPLFNALGEVTGILAVAADITSRKKVEDELRSSMVECTRQNKHSANQDSK